MSVDERDNGSSCADGDVWEDSCYQIISDKNAQIVLKALMFGITPSISFMGLIGNVLSIKILIRHGLQKSSNILLFSLAIADFLFLVGFNSVPKIMRVVNGDGSFPYPRPVAFALYILYLVFLFLDYVFGLAGLTIPMLITLERFVAVFFPLKFPQIMTNRRIYMAVAGVCLYWVVYITYTCFWFDFQYVYDSDRNRSVGLLGRSALFYKDLPNIAILNEVFFSIKIPPVFTLIGCVSIIIKLRFLSYKRREMTNTPQEQANMKTNKMLLALCVVYLSACLILALPTYLPPEWVAYDLTSEKPSNMGLITYQLINTFICLNSSWNFIIYVGINKNFRDIFKDMIRNSCFSCCISRKSVG